MIERPIDYSTYNPQNSDDSRLQQEWRIVFAQYTKLANGNIQPNDLPKNSIEDIAVKIAEELYKRHIDAFRPEKMGAVNRILFSYIYRVLNKKGITLEFEHKGEYKGYELNTSGEYVKTRGVPQVTDTKKCMLCDAMPTTEVLWAGGIAHAWFCSLHFGEWRAKHEQEILDYRKINGTASVSWDSNIVKEVIDMPWSTSDVEKHCSGLTEKQKRVWVNVANSTLESCISDGGNDESCAPKAIRSANSVAQGVKEVYADIDPQLKRVGPYSLRENQFAVVTDKDDTNTWLYPIINESTIRGNIVDINYNVSCDGKNFRDNVIKAASSNNVSLFDSSICELLRIPEYIDMVSAGVTINTDNDSETTLHYVTGVSDPDVFESARKLKGATIIESALSISLWTGSIPEGFSIIPIGNKTLLVRF